MRILAYTALLYQGLLRTSSAPLPPVLPIVLYHGRERWTAPEEVAGLHVAPGGFLAPYQPPQRYFLLNIGGYTDSSLPSGRNLVAALIRLERSRSMKDVEAVSDTLDEWLSGPAHQGLKRAFDEWIRQAIAPAKVRGIEWPPVEKQSEDGTMSLRETAKEWPRQWLEEGRAKNQVEGQAQMMHRIAARKFDRATADRLAERLAGIDDSEQVAEIGEWIIECESGEELLGRVERVSASLTTGGPASCQS